MTRKFGLNYRCSGMSALGQKQTCAVQLAMSALPLKADIGNLFAIHSFERSHGERRLTNLESRKL
jgi:hypothetical protein